MRKGHTIIELLVAMGLLVAIMAGSGAVFHEAITAYRTATATAEISQKLQAITTQLDADFVGLQKDAPFAARFTKDGSDQIMFFSNGNFDAYNLTLTGNVARIYYGAANRVDWNDASTQFDVLTNYTESQLLARRQHILSVAGFGFPSIDRDGFDDTFEPMANNISEFDELALGNWKSHCNVTAAEVGDPVIEQIVADNVNKVFETCFADSGRAGLDLNKQGDDVNGPETLQLLMSQGVGEFKITFEYINVDDGQLYWWPSKEIVRDTTADGTPDMSDYEVAGADQFGIYLNMGAYIASQVDSSWGLPLYWGYPGGSMQALKFTFTLYDSRGIFKDGKTFSHIVYLAN